MGVYVSRTPVNPAQIIEKLASTGCTVRADDAKQTWEVDVDGKSDAQVKAAVLQVRYDPTVLVANIAKI